MSEVFLCHVREDATIARTNADAVAILRRLWDASENAG
jgi:hypothetical protein